MWTGSIATSRCVQLAATSTKRSKPLARPSVDPDRSRHGDQDRARQRKRRRAPCRRAVCSSSSAASIGSREPDSARLASAADHIGAGQAARPSSAITTRISRSPPSSRSQPSEATPCPTSLRPDRRDLVRARPSAARRPRSNARRESRAGNREASSARPRPEAPVDIHDRRLRPGRISACASP